MYRKQNTITDRIWACLVYAVPVIEVLQLGFLIFAFIPQLKWVFLPFALLQPIYFLPVGGIAVVEWGIFLTLFIGVARNRSYNYLIRFNTMQSLLLGIGTALCNAFLSLFIDSKRLALFAIEPGGGIGGLLNQGLDFVILAITGSLAFIIVIGCVIYAVIQTGRGEIAEIPVISEAANSQVY